MSRLSNRSSVVFPDPLAPLTALQRPPGKCALTCHSTVGLTANHADPLKQETIHRHQDALPTTAPPFFARGARVSYGTAHHDGGREPCRDHQPREPAVTCLQVALQRSYGDCRLVASSAGRSALARVTASSTAQ